MFQRTVSSILQGLDGVICHTLVYGETQEQHYQRLRAVLQHLQETGVTLNDKCEFSKLSVKFLGHIANCNDVRPDPAKTEAIKNFSDGELPNSSDGE